MDTLSRNERIELSRKQTKAVIVRFEPQDKTRIDQTIPKMKLAPLLRRLLLEHVEELEAQRPGDHEATLFDEAQVA